MRKVLSLLAVLAVLAALTGCKTTKLVDSDTKTKVTEETVETKHNLGITVPGWDLGISGSIASRIVWIPKIDKSGDEPCIVIKPGVIVTGKDSIAALKFQIDSLGNYSAQASQRQHELQVEITEKTKIIREQTETIERYKERDSKLKNFFEDLAIWIVVVIGGIALILFLLKRL